MVYIFWKNFGTKIGKILDERKEIALSEMAAVEEEKKSILDQKSELQKLRKESKRRANDILIKAERQADERKEKILSGDVSCSKIYPNAFNPVTSIPVINKCMSCVPS